MSNGVVTGRISPSPDDKSGHAGRAMINFEHAADRITFYESLATFKNSSTQGEILTGMDGGLWFTVKRDGTTHRFRVSCNELANAVMRMFERLEADDA